MRPVMRGLISGESLVNGAVDLSFIAVLNDACDVEDENNRRARAAAEKRWHYNSKRREGRRVNQIL